MLLLKGGGTTQHKVPLFIIKMTDLILHDDYEGFANYLGVDYDDYVNLELGLQDDEDGIEIEYSINF